MPIAEGFDWQHRRVRSFQGIGESKVSTLGKRMLPAAFQLKHSKKILPAALESHEQKGRHPLLLSRESQGKLGFFKDMRDERVYLKDYKVGNEFDELEICRAAGSGLSVVCVSHFPKRIIADMFVEAVGGQDVRKRAEAAESKQKAEIKQLRLLAKSASPTRNDRGTDGSVNATILSALPATTGGAAASADVKGEPIPDKEVPTPVAGGADPATRDTPRQAYATADGGLPLRPKIPKDQDAVPAPSDRGFQNVYKITDPKELDRRGRMIDEATVQILRNCTEQANKFADKNNPLVILGSFGAENYKSWTQRGNFPEKRGGYPDWAQVQQVHRWSCDGMNFHSDEIRLPIIARYCEEHPEFRECEFLLVDCLNYNDPHHDKRLRDHTGRHPETMMGIAKFLDLEEQDLFADGFMQWLTWNPDRRPLVILHICKRERHRSIGVRNHNYNYLRQRFPGLIYVIDGPMPTFARHICGGNTKACMQCSHNDPNLDAILNEAYELYR